jgi:uncharacterized protein YbbC (DUF1343 family)
MFKSFAIILVFLSCSIHAMDYGIDRLSAPEVIKILEGKSLGVLTHAAGRSKTGIHLIDFLHQQFSLKKIFAPEHGLRTTDDSWVEDGIDEETGLTVISLYKRGSRAPRSEDLAGLDAIVVDLQDVGVRYYTYFSTIAEIMKATAPLNIEVILLDRPNLLGGRIIEGKVLDSELAGSFISYHTVPTRHGMTLGELALMIHEEQKIKTKLTVIPVSGWNRESLLLNYDRPWLAPSPALVDLSQVSLYALWGTMENFNLAVGRGLTNEAAFHRIGAPWITKDEALSLAQALNHLKFPGATFAVVNWKVTRSLYVGQMANGVQLEWSGEDIRTDEFTYKVSSLLLKMFKGRIQLNTMSPHFYGSKKMIDAMLNSLPWETYRLVIDAELSAFKQRRASFLLY